MDLSSKINRWTEAETISQGFIKASLLLDIIIGIGLSIIGGIILIIEVL